jgi:HEPN domain-containing protein
MSEEDEINYRLRLAEGYVEEARQDVPLQRWRSCVDNSQLAVENAGKAALALLGPVGRTHEPGVLIRRELDAGRFPAAHRAAVERLAECTELLGWDVHVQSDYGDELNRRTPWELFDEAAAQRALALAEEAVNLAGQVTQPTGPP